MLPILVAGRARVPELDAAYAEIVAEKRARSAAVVRRGIERGDFRADVDLELVVDAYVEPDLLPLPRHQRRRSTTRSVAVSRRHHAPRLRHLTRRRPLPAGGRSAGRAVAFGLGPVVGLAPWR